MGRFINPSNAGFQAVLNSEIYVDKTNLLKYMNKLLFSSERYICNSRPRRFGKSIAADMLVAYYSKGCNSSKLFENLEISKDPSFAAHLNKYDVIRFDVQGVATEAQKYDSTPVKYVHDAVLQEVKETYSGALSHEVKSLREALSLLNSAIGTQFIVIIDEWDYLIRDEKTSLEQQKEYVDFLRSLFKGSGPDAYIKLAYLTGILPILRYKTQSALNNFTEYTMLDADFLAPYVGFTEDEVKALCEKYNRDFSLIKRWYDGYLVEDYAVYNPNSVVKAITRGKCRSYWSLTSSYNAILDLIEKDFDGLKEAVVKLVSGARVRVTTDSYLNDMRSFKNKDEVLTALIHLGYLGFDQQKSAAFVPNEEIRNEFVIALEVSKNDGFFKFQKESEALLQATLELNCDAVAKQVEKIHNEYASVIQYNNENSLSSVISIAYLTSLKYYMKPLREFRSGTGFADVVYIPKPEYADEYPALIIELKWNKSASLALEQIKQKKYYEAVANFTNNMLLVGISYDKTTKAHTAKGCFKLGHNVAL